MTNRFKQGCEGPRQPLHILGSGRLESMVKSGRNVAGDGCVLIQKHILIYFTSGISTLTPKNVHKINKHPNTTSTQSSQELGSLGKHQANTRHNSMHNSRHELYSRNLIAGKRSFFLAPSLSRLSHASPKQGMS